jgi:hypothetical protein
VCEHALELGHLLPQLRIPGLRLFRDPLEPPFDVVAVRHEELETKRLEVVGRNARAGETVQHNEECIHLPKVAEQLRAGAAHLYDADRGRRDLSRVHDVGDRRQAGVRDRGHPDIPRRPRTGERMEERRLAGAR